jgi:PadR family transcriptional regulator AphA
MDVRTICLGILTRGDATGYEIKKLFDDDGYHHFVEASFGSIYPALSRMTEDGLVSVREESQEKRPDRKVYSITAKGREAFVASLMKPLPEDRHRSPFVFAMLFADLLPQERVTHMLNDYIAQAEMKLAQLDEIGARQKTQGERTELAQAAE